MNRRLALVSGAMVLASPLAAVGQSGGPRFGDYPAGARYTGRRVAPRLRPGTEAWYFRTRIREAARQAPNFAGHYVLAQWGCGTECLSSAVIDVATGAVYLPGFTTCCWYSVTRPAGAPDVEPLRFRLGSRLVVFTGLLNEEGRNGPHYFRLERGRLIALP